MKAFTTESKMSVEEKYESVQVVKNLCNLIRISNLTVNTYADPGDMREVCIRCDPLRAGNWQYFSKFLDELTMNVDGMDEVGLKALFFYFVYDHKISADFGNGQAIPVTDLQNVQTEATVDSILSYIRHILDEGIHVSPFQLRDSHPSNKNQFGEFFGGREVVAKMDEVDNMPDITMRPGHPINYNQTSLLLGTRPAEEPEDVDFWIRMVPRSQFYQNYLSYCLENDERPMKNGNFFLKLGEVLDRDFNLYNNFQNCPQKRVKIYSPDITTQSKDFIFALRHKYKLIQECRRYIVLPSLQDARRAFVLKMRMAFNPWEEETQPADKRQRVTNDKVKRVNMSQKEAYVELERHSKPCIMVRYNHSPTITSHRLRRVEFVGRDGCLTLEQVNWFASRGVSNHARKIIFDVSRYQFSKSRDLNAMELMPATTIVNPPPVEQHHPEFGQLFMTRDEAAQMVADQIQLPQIGSPLPVEENPVYQALYEVEDPEMPSLHTDDSQAVSIEAGDESSGSAQSTPLGHDAHDLGSHDSYSGASPEYHKPDWRDRMDQEDMARYHSDYESEMESWEMNLTPK